MYASRHAEESLGVTEKNYRNSEGQINDVMITLGD